MKNTIVSVMLALFLAFGLAHATVDVQESALTFNTEDDGTITFTNNFNDTLVITFDDRTLVFDSDNNITIRQQAITLNPLSTKAITIDVESTSDVESGNYLGTMRILNQSNNVFFDSVALTAQVPALEIDKISVTDSKLDKGQKFTITVDVKNIGDVTDLENVEVEVRVLSGDEDDFDIADVVEDINGDELEGDEEIGDLRDGRSDSVDFTFEMPFEVDDGDKLTIWAKVVGDSEDAPSRTFTVTDTKEIEASVPESEIEVTRLNVIPSVLQCGVTSTKLNVEVQNIGEDAQDVELFFRNQDTAFEKMLYDGEELELENDYTDEDEFTESFEETIRFQERDLNEGANTFTLVAYYDNSNIEEDVVITYIGCEPEEPTVTPVVTPVVVPTVPTTPVAPTPTVTPVTTPQVTLKDVSGGFDGGVVIPTVIGVLGAVVGVLIAILFIRK